MLKELIKELQKHEWLEEEGTVSLQVVSNFFLCYLLSKKVYKDLPGFSIVTFYGINDYCYEQSSKDETKKLLEAVIKKCQKFPHYLDEKYQAFKEGVFSEIRKTFFEIKKSVKSFSNKELLSLYKKVVNLGREQYSYTTIAEAADVIEQKDFLKFLPKKIGRKKSGKLIQILSSPAKLSFLNEERISFLELCLNFLKKKDIEEKLRDHTQDYFWIQTNFYKAKYLNRNYFLKEIKKHTKNKTLREIKKELQSLKEKPTRLLAEQEKLIKKYRLSRKAKIFFDILQKFAIIQDNRKESGQRVIHCLDMIFKQISRRKNIKKIDLYKYTVEEIIELLEKNKRVSKKDLLLRRKWVLVAWKENKKIQSRFLVGKDAEEIINYFEEKKRITLKERTISGMVASIGKNPNIQGKVRIVLDPKKIKNFQKGEILVAGMTRPEFLPLMRKAKAVITNEGGITTHAAIVSRELNIPCIIGTKIATKVLKNGDLIEVNTRKGIIKILKK